MPTKLVNCLNSAPIAMFRFDGIVDASSKLNIAKMVNPESGLMPISQGEVFGLIRKVNRLAMKRQTSFT